MALVTSNSITPRYISCLESLSQYLGAAQDVEIWATHAAHDTTGFLLAVAVTAILLLLITYIFIPIGQTVSRQLDLAPRPLYGYSWNLAGSLAGIVAFFAVSWGTTWQVNGIVIAAILSTLLLANYVIEQQKQPWPRSWNLLGILIGIAFAYFVPFSRIPGSAAVVGCCAAFIFAIPVFFAGLLFASEFRAAESPAAALGANMLGAVVGGLLENLSLIIGMKALLLVAALLYCLAAIGFRGLPSPRPQSPNGAS